ncbi:serine--tRNA ligase [Actinacidiphila sp. ITFR-21]|uniref:serine--tRNA ligase n=1 Tax=Actinacidiphila sp. ITFR-21 TaxID=3075199 RepID=UPI00288B1C33|nr:serine--tRNA ligase [Streptomyces sp. ITFR-21]WNI18004.1 serine--tRNA ligase [Streptomyces sp. ITFR-21]
MLDKNFVRNHPDAVKEAVRVKGIDLDVDELIRLEEHNRGLQFQVDEAQRQRKSLSKEFAKADETRRAELRTQSSELDGALSELRAELSRAGAELRELLLLTPGIPWEGAPVGDDESANVVIRSWGKPPAFDFAVLDHVEIAERRGWAEFARARQVSGERAYTLNGDLLMLERALHSYALDLLRTKDFTPISVPSLVKEEALVGTGMFPKGRSETYELPAENLFLAGTAEVGLVGLHSGEILDKSRLPIRYAGISPCFRREIGSAGRDVRGLLRVHQFEKVEQFVICEADVEVSARWHQELLATAEQILQELGLAYEVVECATGDMGVGKFRMNDINTWIPSLETYRETHSCSTLHDWQARRAGLKYRDSDGTVRIAHTLNNTAVATPRLLAAVVENFQTADQKVRVPEVLRPYLGNRELL